MMPICPQCGATENYRFRRRRIMRCKSCGTDFTSTSGTAFSNSKLSDQKRNFLVSYIIANPDMSSQKIANAASVSLKTAWLWKVRILAGQDAAKGYFQGTRRASGLTKAIWNIRHVDPWTKYRQGLFESMWRRGCPISCMAAMFDVEPGTISSRASRHGLPTRAKR